MTKTLNTLNFLVKRGLERPNAPPILGLVELGDADARIETLAHFLAGNVGNLEGAFSAFPFATAWVVATIVRRRYGAGENHAVYPPLERALGISLDGVGRKILRKGFDSVCRRIGITTAGYARSVDVYLAQAGVPEGMLDHLAAAFLRQERHYGSPPLENTSELNEWEDLALEQMPAGIQSPRYAVQLDETGWHAALFAEIRRNGPERGDSFDRAFRAAIKAQEVRIAGSGWTTAVARPRLSWQDDTLTLEVPPIEGRLFLSTGVDQFRLASRRLWRVPQPWPRLMSWEVGETKGELTVLDQPGAIAIFDRLSGRLIKHMVAGGEVEKLDGREVVLLAREPFAVDGAPAVLLGDEAYAAFHSLSLTGSTLQIATKQQIVAARPVRRITAANGVVANGQNGPLLGGDALFRIETGLAAAEQRVIRLVGAGREAAVTIAFDESGTADLNLAHLVDALSQDGQPRVVDPFRLRIELPVVRSGSSALGLSTVFVASFWVWPGVRLSSDGMTFEAPSAPYNLVVERCRNIEMGSEGRVYLSGQEQGGYAKARLVFEIDRQFVDFDVPFPDVTCVRQLLDGREQFLPLGSSIVLRPDERFDTISIRCPDPDADLTVRSRLESKPFRQTSRRNIALRDLLYASGDERVVLRRGSGHEVELFRVVEAIAPRRFESRMQDGALILTLEMQEPIDAIALDLENDFGAKTHEEVALAYRPVAQRPPDWLRAEIPNSAPSQVKVRVALDQLDVGLHLARVSVRSQGSGVWKRIENSRGDVFAVVLVAGSYGVEVGLSQRFRTLTRWMAHCFSKEAWEQVGPVLPRYWERLGRRLLEQPSGAADLLAAATVEPDEDASASWIPIAHPLTFAPELYGLPARQFAALAASENESALALSIVSDVAGGNLQQLELLDTAALFGFENAERSSKTGEPLRGFSASRFFSLLPHPHLDRDAGAGALWRGKPLLGPAHWRSAHLRLAERLEAAGLFGEFTAEDNPPNGLRQIRLQKLMQVCLKRAVPRPPVPKRDAADEEPHIVDEWAACTLASFSAAARNSAVVPWARKLAEEIGGTVEEVLSDVAFLLRLAPELFAFHMGVAELANAAPGRLQA